MGNDNLDPDDLFPISAIIRQEQDALYAARKEAILRRRAERLEQRNRTPGRLIPGKGIYVGAWSPMDRDGKSLGKTFHVYAAPHDLGFDARGKGEKLVGTFYEAVIATAQIKNLLGHKGVGYANDTKLYNALRSGAYKGEWFIPSYDILTGRCPDGSEDQRDNILRHSLTGAFEGTFANGNPGTYRDYWSCTEAPGESDCMRVVSLPNDPRYKKRGESHKEFTARGCRLVRAELAPE